MEKSKLNNTTAGLAGLFQGINTGIQNNRANQIAQTQLSYQDPNRQISAKDVLPLAIAAQKEHDQNNLIAKMTGNGSQLQPFDSGKFIRETMAMLNGASGTPSTSSQMPQQMAPMQSAPIPVSANPQINIPQGVGGQQPQFMNQAMQSTQAMTQQNSAPVPVDMNRVNSLIEELYQARRAKGV
jgi:hypothetical protein